MMAAQRGACCILQICTYAVGELKRLVLQPGELVVTAEATQGNYSLTAAVPNYVLCLLATCKILANALDASLLFLQAPALVLLRYTQLNCHRSSPQHCCQVGIVAAAAHCLLLEKALLLHQRNTMNANTIKAAAKPLGMLAVRCAAPSQSTFCPRIEREAPRR